MERRKVEIGPEILLPIGPVKTRTLLRADPRQRDRDPIAKDIFECRQAFRLAFVNRIERGR